MTIDAKVVPISLEQQTKIKEGVNAGTIPPICAFCSTNPCYELSIQGQYIIKNILFDEGNLVCRDCFDWMQRKGAWFSRLLRVVLRIKLRIKRRRT